MRYLARLQGGLERIVDGFQPDQPEPRHGGGGNILDVLSVASRQQHRVDSGALRRSIKVRARKRSRRYIGSLVLIGVDLEDGRGTFTEFGTDRLRQTRFVRRAVEERRDQVLNEVSAQILRELGALG